MNSTANESLLILSDVHLGNDLNDVTPAGARRSALVDADLANLAGLTNLKRLTLANSPVTDAGLTHLKGLAQLESLNLFHTAVTDAGRRRRCCGRRRRVTAV